MVSIGHTTSFNRSMLLPVKINRGTTIVSLLNQIIITAAYLPYENTMKKKNENEILSKCDSIFGSHLS